MFWVGLCLLTACGVIVGTLVYDVLSHRLEERIARRMLDIFLDTPTGDIERRVQALVAAEYPPWRRRVAIANITQVPVHTHTYN